MLSECFSFFFFLVFGWCIIQTCAAYLGGGGPKIRGTILGVPMISIIVFGGLYIGPI